MYTPGGGQRGVLKIIYRGNIFLLHPGPQVLQLGRDDGNDIVVQSLFASRVHAHVRWREGEFVLKDLSSNGTFLMSDDHAHEIHMRGGEAVLAERGWLGIGRSAAQHGDHSVRYSLEHEEE
jgi:adenylate cyclase